MVLSVVTETVNFVRRFATDVLGGRPLGGRSMQLWVMRLPILAAAFLLVGLLGLVVNYWGAIEGRCTDEGWSGCGWTWYLCGYTVLLSLAGLAGVLLLGLYRGLRDLSRLQ